MGDINIVVKIGILLNNNWKQQIELYDYTQIMKEPTRVTAHSENIIDYVMPPILLNFLKFLFLLMQSVTIIRSVSPGTVAKNQLKRCRAA